jgi:hypothetical protein
MIALGGAIGTGLFLGSCSVSGSQSPQLHPFVGSTRTCEATTLDLHGFHDLVDPRVDRGDSLLERDVHARADPCGCEVGSPMLMSDNYARPGTFGPSERTGIISTSRKDCLGSNAKFEQRRAAFRAGQVTEQQEVDDVAGPVVDRRRRVMRIGACMELLCDLEPQCERRESVRTREPESCKRWGKHDLGAVSGTALVRGNLDLNSSPSRRPDAHLHTETHRLRDSRWCLDVLNWSSFNGQRTPRLLNDFVEDDQEPGQVTTDEAVDVAGCACVKAKAVLKERSAFEEEQRTGLIDCTLQSRDHHCGSDQPPEPAATDLTAKRLLSLSDPTVKDAGRPRFLLLGLS